MQLSSSWLDWITSLGHDTYAFPAWISEQQRDCVCRQNASARVRGDMFVCTTDGGRTRVDWRSEVNMSFCGSKLWLLEHMPSFDLHFLPGSVTVNSTSMLDDVVAFALMADRAANYAHTVPMALKFSYVLPFGSYHESRQNWRPLFFAKFFGLVQNATSVHEAIGRLIAPDVILDWNRHFWPSSPVQPPKDGSTYRIEWASSTSPPVYSPLEFVAYGYGSCSAWATYITYVLRAVGIPARQAGTPCWNSVYSGVDYRGLSARNPNVSLCWHGGSSATGHGGGFLNNHNWVEVFLPAKQSHGGGKGGAAAGESEAKGGEWTFINVPPPSKDPDAGLCGDNFDPAKGCGFDESAPPGHECDKVNGGPGAAMRDHEILAVTWSHESGEPPASEDLEGGPVLDVAGRTLTDGATPLTPLVWAPKLASPLGEPLRDVGLRVVNRTEFYRCKPTTRVVSPAMPGHGARAPQ